MKLWESLLGLMAKDRDKPLHVGEVMNIWKIMVAYEEGHAVFDALRNHTADPELKRLVESFLNEFESPWMDRIKRFMQEEAIPLPQTSTTKTNANQADIPPGAKLSDQEIADLLAAKLVASTAFVQQALLECLNYKLATLLVELEVAAYRHSFVVRETMERRGWLMQPPPWHGSKPAE